MSYAQCSGDNAHLFGYRKHPKQMEQPTVPHALALCDACTVTGPCHRYHQAEQAHGKVAAGRVWWLGVAYDYTRPAVLPALPSRAELEAVEADLPPCPPGKHPKRERKPERAPTFATSVLARAEQAYAWALEIDYPITPEHREAVEARLADPTASLGECASAVGLSKDQVTSRIRRFATLVEAAYRAHQLRARRDEVRAELADRLPIGA